MAGDPDDAGGQQGKQKALNRLGLLEAGLVVRLVLFLGGVGIMLGMLGALQKKMIYFPAYELEADPAAAGLDFENVHVTTSDGLKLHGWFVPRAGAETTLFFLHGNAGNISHRLDNIVRLHKLGMNVFILDYRGYGHSEGAPDEKGLYRDADAGFSYLLAREDIDREHLAVFGRSLGGAVAVDLCSRVDCRRLILESTFTNTADMAREIFFLPLGPLLTERFDSINKISKIGCPLLQFHGTRDEVIPYKLGNKLFQAASRPKWFVDIPGAGHNDTYVKGDAPYFEKIRTFLTTSSL